MNSVHALESRQLFSVSIVGKDVIINGTSGIDQISFSITLADGPDSKVTLNGHVTPIPFETQRILVWSGPGDDSIDYGFLNNGPVSVFIDAGKGHDRVECVGHNGGPETILGKGGDDTILGVSGPATIYGGAGNDHVRASNDSAFVFGEDGNDIIDGFDGNNTLHGGNGNDTIRGGTGNDILYGGEGNDLLDGANGDDRILGNAGNDTLIGNAGNDTLIGGPGHDFNYPDAPSSRLRRFLQNLFE